VPTLGILPEKETRVLKERRISARVPDIAPGLLYAVFLQNTPILSDAVPRVGTLGWYALPPSGQFAVPRAMPCLVCVAPLGQMERWRFDPACSDPNPALRFHPFSISPILSLQISSPIPHLSIFHLRFHLRSSLSVFSFQLSTFIFPLSASGETPACRSVIFR
jgi:hypothetical protein